MTALYRSIYDTLKTSILNGSLRGGQKLPSSRTLAENLGVSRNTVLCAFAHLETEGFTESRRGSGMYVRNISLTGSVRSTSSGGNKRSIVSQKKYAVTFRANPEERAFPYHEYAKITSKLYREKLTMHDGELERQLASWLEMKRGVKCCPEQIIITNGSQEALFLTAMYLLSVKKSPGVIMEDPCYRTAKQIFRHFTDRITCIPVDENGMNIEKMHATKNSIVYVTPSRQFPLGYTMSIDRRLKLLEMARENNLTVIEDDFDSDFRYSGEPVMSLQSYDRNDTVIYTGTFTKILFGGIRLGYAVLPEKHLTAFRNLRAIINQPPSPLNCSVTAEFMRSGKFHRHLKKMHGLYRERKNRMTDEFKRELGEILELIPCDSGLHMHALFRKYISRTKLKQTLTDNGIEIFLLSDFSEKHPLRDGLIFGFAAFTEKECKGAVKLLKKAVMQALK